MQMNLGGTAANCILYPFEIVLSTQGEARRAVHTPHSPSVTTDDAVRWHPRSAEPWQDARVAVPLIVKLRQLTRAAPTASQLHHSVAVPRHDSAAVTLLLPMPGESYSSSVPGADSRRRRHTAYIFGFCTLCPRHMTWMRQRDTLYCVSLNMCVGACLWTQ